MQFLCVFLKIFFLLLLSISNWHVMPNNEAISQDSCHAKESHYGPFIVGLWKHPLMAWWRTMPHAASAHLQGLPKLKGKKRFSSLQFHTSFRSFVSFQVLLNFGHFFLLYTFSSMFYRFYFFGNFSSEFLLLLLDFAELKCKREHNYGFSKCFQRKSSIYVRILFNFSFVVQFI